MSTSLKHRPPRGVRRTLGAAGIAVCLGVIGASPAPAAPSGTAPSHHGAGSLVLVGGGLKDDNAQVYGEIVRRAGGPGRARIGILTAASVPASQDPDAGDPEKCSNSECNGAYYADLFRRHGAGDAQWIPVDLDHVANADSDAVVRQINSMTGFFFGGGDQYRYVTTLLHGARHTDSKVLAAIRAKLTDGAVVSGSSAGAQIASGPDMVTGGDSYPALRDGSRPGYFDDPTVLGYLPHGGFGFLRSGLLDTHTGTTGREGRALRLAADTGHDIVYALDEDTALVVDRPGSGHERVGVIGRQGVSVLNLSAARAGEGPAGWHLHNARYSYLTSGDSYDPRTGTVASPGKDRLAPTSSGVVPPNTDVFYSPDNAAGTPYSLRTTARALAASTRRTATATTYESGPRFTVTLTEPRGFRPLSADGTTPQTLLDLRLDIDPDAGTD
ncbi:cyanophycinase [Streptomyces recifensis]|uniref:cyanophycinase n=1 Tax=Streptomyces recifensis TaxID=67355 RepID=UPI000A3AD22C|nr:cyanophycinase [Streptomyces recifensis]